MLNVTLEMLHDLSWYLICFAWKRTGGRAAGCYGDIYHHCKHVQQIDDKNIWKTFPASLQGVWTKMRMISGSLGRLFSWSFCRRLWMKVKLTNGVSERRPSVSCSSLLSRRQQRGRGRLSGPTTPGFPFLKCVMKRLCELKVACVSGCRHSPTACFDERASRPSARGNN